MLKFETPIARVSPALHVAIRPFQVDTRQPLPLYSGLAVSQSGSVVGIEGFGPG